jgi:hypothetical protein
MTADPPTHAIEDYKSTLNMHTSSIQKQKSALFVSKPLEKPMSWLSIKDFTVGLSLSNVNTVSKLLALKVMHLTMREGTLI